MRTLRIAIAACLVVSGCASTRQQPKTAPVPGSAEAPFVTENCRTAEPHPPEPGYVSVGALDLPTMPDLAATYGGAPLVPDADGVSFYKGGIEVRGDHPVVTVTIGVAARSYARIQNESYHGPLPHGAVAVTYAGKPKSDSEKTWTCWYVGGYNLLNRQITACLPLDVAFAGDPVVRHVTIPIGARCPG